MSLSSSRLRDTKYCDSREGLGAYDSGYGNSTELVWLTGHELRFLLLKSRVYSVIKFILLPIIHRQFTLQNPKPQTPFDFLFFFTHVSVVWQVAHMHRLWLYWCVLS